MTLLVYVTAKGPMEQPQPESGPTSSVPTEATPEVCAPEIEEHTYIDPMTQVFDAVIFGTGITESIVSG